MRRCGSIRNGSMPAPLFTTGTAMRVGGGGNVENRRPSSHWIEGWSKENLLEGRIAAREPHQLAEKPIVEYAIACADGGFALLKGVPGQCDARLKVVPV